MDLDFSYFSIPFLSSGVNECASFDEEELQFNDFFMSLIGWKLNDRCTILIVKYVNLSELPKETQLWQFLQQIFMIEFKRVYKNWIYDLMRH